MSNQFDEMERMDKIEWFYGNYRGIVVANSETDFEKPGTITVGIQGVPGLGNAPKNMKGMIKIYVPGVYPDEYEKDAASLPWAEPAMPIFGGNTAGAMVNSTPKIGTDVWCFFDQGDWNFPIYFASVEGGKDWVAAHSKQHTIQTDHFKLTIDEDLTEQNIDKQVVPNTFNKKTSPVGKNYVEDDLPCRASLTVEGTEGVALNIIIKGKMNMMVEGDVYEHIKGSKYTTIEGSHYTKIHNHLDETIAGDKNSEVKGNIVESFDGAREIIYKDDVTEHFFGNYTVKCKKDYDLDVNGLSTFFARHGKKETIWGMSEIDCTANRYERYKGDLMISVDGWRKCGTLLGSIDNVNGIRNEYTGLIRSAEIIGADNLLVGAGQIINVIGVQSTIVAGAQLNSIGGAQLNNVVGVQENAVVGGILNNIGGAVMNIIKGIFSTITPDFIFTGNNFNVQAQIGITEKAPIILREAKTSISDHSTGKIYMSAGTNFDRVSINGRITDFNMNSQPIGHNPPVPPS